MRFVADLHVHSRLSRATSRDLDLEHLHQAAQRKGVGVVGTGDFTHPGWFSQLREKLTPAGDGLFVLRDDLAREADAEVPPACRAEVRFMLQVEVSNIYKRGDRVRKVHNLVYAPSFESAARFSAKLAKIGNIASDGRPILGLDSRDLLEIVLESSPDAFLIPAHIWTPWFSALGAQSGFDSIAECFGDLAQHVFAAETGLSSDPAMNWRLSQLDRLALVSNSDAHSPDKVGREANVFDCERSYFALRDALAGRAPGFLGTVEFFPEEGKYHYDGHRKCGVWASPSETRATVGRCPKCGKRLTAGVLSRVEALADRSEGARPQGARSYRSLVPLAEILGEVMGAGRDTVRVRRALAKLLERLGSELAVLVEAPIEDIAREGPPLLAEAVRRMREGKVRVRPGYDGEYGLVRLFDEVELRRLLAQLSLAISGIETKRPEPEASTPAAPVPSEPRRATRRSDALDETQLRAVDFGAGPLLVVAGPGTGKTRTLVHRIAHLVGDRGVSPSAITAITFTRRAAGEMRDRLRVLLGEPAERIGVMTFHAFGLEVLRAFADECGLPPDFAVLDEAKRIETVAAATGTDGAGARKLADGFSRAKATLAPLEAPAAAFAAYQEALAVRGLVDFDDLVVRSAELIARSPRARAWARERCGHLFVDEYQDVNAAQYRLVQILAPPDGRPNLCAVGDPDQAIYGFRGSDPSFFGRFEADYPGAATVVLQQNYRSPAAVVRAATEVIERSAGRRPRPLVPLELESPPLGRFTGGTDEDEAEFIAAEIERAVGGTSLLSADGGRADDARGQPLAFHDVAVLFRIGAQAEALEKALDRAGIPHQHVGEAQVAGRPHLAEFYQRLTRLVGPADAGEIAEADAALRGEVGRRPVAEIVDALYRTGREGADRRRAADLLAAFAVPFGTDAAGFAAHLAILRDDDLGLETQKVALLTLHSSKGLEFPLVFIAGCEDGLLPLSVFGRSPSDEDEERRLFYVGMTRARARLVLTAARRRALHGRAGECRPSPFLDAIEAGLVENLQAPSRRPRVRQMRLF